MRRIKNAAWIVVALLCCQAQATEPAGTAHITPVGKLVVQGRKDLRVRVSPQFELADPYGPVSALYRIVDSKSSAKSCELTGTLDLVNYLEETSVRVAKITTRFHRTPEGVAVELAATAEGDMLNRSHVFLLVELQHSQRTAKGTSASLHMTDANGDVRELTFHPQLAVNTRRFESAARWGMENLARWDVHDAGALWVGGRSNVTPRFRTSFIHSGGTISIRYPLSDAGQGAVRVELALSADVDVDLGWSPVPAHIREAIANPEDVTDLGSYNLVQSVPPEIGRLKDLQKLSIAGPMRTLPDSIGELTSLVHLNVGTGARGTGVTHFPDSFGRLGRLESLVVYGTPFRRLPSTVGNLSRLKSIFIAHCLLEGLPEQIGDCESLEFIKLPDNKPMTTIPESIGRLKKLHYLDLAGVPNSITRLPEGLGDCENLERFHLAGPLQTWPASFGRLQKLRVAAFSVTKFRGLPEEMRGTFFKELPSSLADMRSLRRFSLRGNPEMVRVAGAFGDMPSLVSLHLTRLPMLSQWQGDLSEAPNLRVLQLDDTALTHPPAGLRELEHLVAVRVPEAARAELAAMLPGFVAVGDEYLVRRDLAGRVAFRGEALRTMVSNNSLWHTRTRRAFDEAPVRFLDCAGRGLAGTIDLSFRWGPIRNSHRRADLSGNRLAGVSERFFAELRALEELDLSRNRLTALPDGLSYLKNLKSLNLSGNPLTDSLDILRTLPALRTVNLSGIEGIGGRADELRRDRPDLQVITSQPAGDRETPVVTHVDLAALQVTKLGFALAAPEKVESIDLSFNELVEWPIDPATLPKLSELRIECNLLDELPESIGRCARLEILDCAMNGLKRLPSSIARLENLRVLDCAVNELVTLPDEITVLRSLRRLNLSANELRTLPADLSGLVALELLDLRGNPLADGELERVRRALPDTRVLPANR